MALEQTINADAASRLTGISAFIQSEGARRRWMITRAVRSAIVSNLLSKAGMHSLADTSKEIKPSRVQRDNEDLTKLVHAIRTTMNPFEQEPDNNLFCMATGKKVRDDIKEDLLNFEKKGDIWCKEFMTGCFSDPSRFEKPIPRRKVQTFATAAIKSKATAKDLKVKELTGTRDLFGRLLYLSTVEKLDLEKVFQYPLTQVPLSLAHRWKHE